MFESLYTYELIGIMLFNYYFKTCNLLNMAYFDECIQYLLKIKSQQVSCR